MDRDDKYTNESLRVVPAPRRAAAPHAHANLGGPMAFMDRVLTALRQRGGPAQFVFDANANAYDDEDGSMSDEDDDEDDDGCVAPQSLSVDGVVVRLRKGCVGRPCPGLINSSSSSSGGSRHKQRM